MDIPSNFQFSQSALQDYVDCPRRFYLRYIRRILWPAVESEPILENEQFIQQGQAFHRLVHQFFLGVPAEVLFASVQNEPVHSWLEDFYDFVKNSPGLSQESSQVYPEFSLSMPWGNYRLVAKYDLLFVTEDQRVIIFDWKTYRKRPEKSWLTQRMQTRVYPYIIVNAGVGAGLLKTIKADQISMVYWFTNFPSNPETFNYNDHQVLIDQQELSTLLDGILDAASSETEDRFPKTLEINRCAYCTYRSLCNRGIQAGANEEAAENESSGEFNSLDFNLDQIIEIEF